MYYVIVMYKDMMMVLIGLMYMRYFFLIFFWIFFDFDNDKLLDGMERLLNCYCIFNICV